MAQPYVTNYYLSWNNFRKSPEYREVMKNLKTTGIKPKYLNNMLRVAFDAGWGNKSIFRQQIS